MFYDEPIHVTIPGDAGDPRFLAAPPAGVVIHRPSLPMLYAVIAEFGG